jgi:hypothetical protein
MEKSLIFIHKPTILILLDDIKHVKCERLGETSQRFFEMTIYTKRGENYEFNNIERPEFDPLNRYFNDKKVSFKSDDMDAPKTTLSGRVRQAPTVMDVDMDLPSEDEEDEDFNSDVGEDEEEEEDDEDFTAKSNDESSKKGKNKKD